MGKVLLVRGALGVLLAVILILVVAWALQRKLIYFPDRSAPVPPPGASEVTLRTTDGLRLGAWLMPPPPGTPDRRLAVLVAPGNAGNRQGRVPLGTALAGLGLTVLLVDYRGYGGNPGTPSEDGLARDVDAARAYLVENVRLPIIYYGESLGAAVVTGLAVREAPVALVLRSPFTSLGEVGREHYPFLPVGALLRDTFPVAALIERVGVPVVVVVHGTADGVVPAAQSAEVAARAGGPVRVVVVEDADHNDAALVHGQAVVDAVTRLAEDLS